MSDPIFQRTLQDLIKGIRNHKKDSSEFISTAFAEIKNELRSTDVFIKAEAVRKLTYLQMIGYNVSWAAFSIVEVMSQPRFAHKRIGYLAANQTFDESTDVVLLTTNLFKKEFSNSSNISQYEVGLAINCLANIATKELARDCISDLVTLMNHQRPYIRKKAILALYKLYVKFPQGLRLTFDKLKDRLDDEESSVVSTAVNVICELSNKNPRNYLAMAPKFFSLLTTSSNNWMLIKVVKLLGSLVSEEPRLARKLLEPLATIIQNTGAKSLQYECIYTVTEALPYSRREDGTEAKNASVVIKLCSDHLKSFIEDHDQNLKYLGLVGLLNLMKSSLKSVVDHRDLILNCLNDDDITIRTKALELLAGIVSKKSLIDLVQHLMQHAKRSEGSYRDEIISKILSMGKRDKYSMVTDFAWYTSILLDLAVMQGSKHGTEVADQLIEIAIRVDTVRPYAVEIMLSMILNDNLVLSHARSTVAEVLKAAAWIVGEYSDIVTRISKDKTNSSSEIDEPTVFWIEATTGEEIRSLWRGQQLHYSIIRTLLHARTTNLSPEVQIVYLQSAMKIFVRACNDCDFQEVADIIGVLRNCLPIFMQSANLEVQERASTLRQLLSEFQILPLNWEESKELIREESKDNNTNINLLDFMPLYTDSSVRSIDESGARNAIQKKIILKMIIKEQFYSVHSKAQKRVPVPEGLNIRNPLNSTALDKLLSWEVPENLSISNLSLFKEPVVVANNGAFNSTFSKSIKSLDDEEVKISKIIQSSFGEEESESRNQNMVFKQQYPQTSFSNPSNNSRHNADDVFMLQNNNSITSLQPSTSNPFYNNQNSNNNGFRNTEEFIPLSKILADQFEDNPSGKQKRKKEKSKEKKKLKEKDIEIDTREMLPANAKLSSDSEDDHTNKIFSRKKKSSKETELDSVDITTPLRADEILTVPTHRVVPNTHSQMKDLNQDEELEQKDTKKKSKKKSKKYNDKNSHSVENDLLALDWNHNESNSQLNLLEVPSIPSISNELLELKPPVLHDELLPSQEIANGSNSSSGHEYYVPCYQNESFELSYSIIHNGEENQSLSCNIKWKVVSISSRLSYMGLTMQPHPNLTYLSSSSIAFLMDSVKNGSLIQETHVQINDISSFLQSHQLSVPISMTIRSNEQKQFTISTTCLFFINPLLKPYKLKETQFAEKLEKVSSKWVNGSLQLPYSSKKSTKHLLKILKNYLNIYLVSSSGEESNPTAGLLSGKTIFDETKIYILVKFLWSSGGSKTSSMNSILDQKEGLIQIDIKCLGSNQNEAQLVSQGISSSLKALII